MGKTLGYHGALQGSSRARVLYPNDPQKSKKPIGVAKYQIVSTLPRSLQKELPAPEQIAELINNI